MLRQLTDINSKHKMIIISDGKSSHRFFYALIAQTIFPGAAEPQKSRASGAVKVEARHEHDLDARPVSPARMVASAREGGVSSFLCFCVVIF